MRHALYQGEGEIPPFWANMAYRRAMNVSWCQLTSQRAQPGWVTRLDLAIMALERSVKRKGT